MNNRKNYRSIADVNGPVLTLIATVSAWAIIDRESYSIAFLGFTIICLSAWAISLIVKQFGIKSLWIVSGFGFGLSVIGGLG